METKKSVNPITRNDKWFIQSAKAIEEWSINGKRRKTIILDGKILVLINANRNYKREII